MYRCVEALSTESAINDWIFGVRWDFFLGTEDMWSEAESIFGESLRRDSHPSVHEEGPSVEMYFSFREVWAGVRDDIVSWVLEDLNWWRSR